ncbi:MFS transporter [Streptomyces sp. NPDC051985]|uniref:MFS transporter n=1 Tax=Streptomyces sp. NPDC051985 TaxID=3155807 RepID=UPI003427ED80
MNTGKGSTPASDAVPAGRYRSEKAIVFAMSLAAMTVSMMLTLVVPILGLIQQSLDTTATDVSWVTTAALLSAAVFTPMLGRFGDQFGNKTTLVGVLLVLIAGTLLAAGTRSILWLIVSRVLQGASIAIFPLALSVLRAEIRPQKLPGAMAMASGAFALGGGVAPVAASMLTTGSHPDYRSVFWLASGLSVLLLVVVLALVPSPHRTTGGRTDILGSLTLAMALVLLLLPVTQGHQWGWSSPSTIGCFAAAAAATAVWVLVERRVSNPLVDMRMFTHPPVLFANLTGLLIGYGTFVLFIGVSQLAQIPSQITGYGFGASSLRTSVEFLLPGTVASMLIAPLGGHLVRRHGPRLVLILASATGTTGFAWLALDRSHTPSVIGAVAFVGLGIGFGYAAMPAIIVASVPQHESGIANGINSISRSTGSAIGSAVTTTVLASKSMANLPAGSAKLPAASQFALSFAIAGAASALVALIAWLGLRRIWVARRETTQGAPRRVVPSGSEVRT